LNGVNGYRFTDKISGASIFMPAVASAWRFETNRDKRFGYGQRTYRRRQPSIVVLGKKSAKNTVNNSTDLFSGESRHSLVSKALPARIFLRYKFMVFRGGV
jgi:hypothetical protein